MSKPCTPGEPQNSWDLWMFIPLKIVLIGIDPYPYIHLSKPIKTDAWIGLFRYLCQGGKVGTYVAVRWLPYVSPALR